MNLGKHFCHGGEFWPTVKMKEVNGGEDLRRVGSMQGRIQEVIHPGVGGWGSESLILAPWGKVEESCPHPPP